MSAGSPVKPRSVPCFSCDADLMAERLTVRMSGDAVTPSSDAAAAAASYCSDEDDDGDSTLASVKTHPLIHSSSERKTKQ